MEFVFFVYGLAFFLLGFAILLYPKSRSEFKLAQSIWLIAGFGILHGINEWLDLFILIQKPLNLVLLEYLRMITLPLSFLFLIQFSAKVLSDRCKKCDALKYLTPFILFIWFVAFMIGGHSAMALDIWSRYILCFTGAFLAGLGCLLYIPDFRDKSIDYAPWP